MAATSSQARIECPGQVTGIEPEWQTDLSAVAFLVRLRSAQPHDEAVAGERHVRHVERHYLGSPNSAGEADQQWHTIERAPDQRCGREVSTTAPTSAVIAAFFRSDAEPNRRRMPSRTSRTHVHTSGRRRKSCGQ